MRRLAVLASLVLLTACGGGGHRNQSASRAAVAAYLTRVDNIEAVMNQPLRDVSAATVAFAHSRDPATTAPALARAEQTLLSVSAQLSLAKSPAAAHTLQTLLLQLIGRQAMLAGELHDFAIFNPAFAAAMRPLAQANTTAHAALKGKQKPAQAADQIRAYRVAVAAAVKQVRTLRPPSVERPLYSAQLKRLTLLDTTLAGLERAVRARDVIAAARLEHAVSVASVSSDSRANQLAEQAAANAYNARVASVQALARRVQQERNRLQVTLR